MTVPASRKKRGRWGMLLLGAILFAGVIVLSGDESLDQIGRVRPVGLAAAFGGTALMLLIFSQRWRGVANALAGRNLDTRRSFFFYSVTASATSIFMPQTANVVVVRTAMLNRLTGVPLGQAGASVVLDKMFDLLPVILLTPPALLLTVGVISLDVMLAVVVIEVVIAAALIRRYHALYMKTVIAVLRWGARIMARLPVLKRLNVAARLERLEGSTDLQGAAVQRASVYTLVGTLAMLLRSWLIAQAIGIEMTPLQMLAGIALAQASLIVAITPGALGTLELGWYVGLSGAGVPGEQISVFLIAHRVLQSVFVLALYLIGYVGQMKINR